MKSFNVEHCQRDLSALAAADKLEHAIFEQVNNLKGPPTALIKKASTMILSGKLSLSEFGLSEQFFEQLEMLVKLNSEARQKYRAIVEQNLAELTAMENTEESHDE